MGCILKMYELKFTYYPHPILRQKSEPLTFYTKPNDDILELIENMKKVCKLPHLNGIGLAAQQVGLVLPVAIVGIPQGDRYKLIGVVNPKIIEISSLTIVGEEGCLSFPKLFIPIERPKRIIVEAWFDDTKKFEKRELFDMGARVASHEIDHLNGIVFIDRTDASTKIEIKPKLQKIARDYPDQKPISLDISGLTTA